MGHSQVMSLQSASSLKWSLHEPVLAAWCAMVRERDVAPLPHAFVHVDHDAHGVTVQSRGQ
jgi:hypothetical protein